MRELTPAQDRKSAAPTAKPAAGPRPLSASHVVPPLVHQVLSSPGQPLDAQTRAFMESRFGHDFSSVRVHVDDMAAESAQAINAVAYTLGQQIVFGRGEYAPATAGGRQLMSHELTHVVQQGGAYSLGVNEPIRISRPDDPAERAAEATGRAIAGGRALPPVGSASAHTLHRAVKTFGGEFNTTNYAPVNDSTHADAAGVGKVVGVDIDLTFTPNDLVETLANGIAMTQTVKTFRSTVAGGPVDTPGNARTVPDFLEAGEGDVGRGIDRVDFTLEEGSTLPTTNPLYGVHNRMASAAAGTAAHVSASLTDTPPGGTASFGSHIRKPDRTFQPAVPATLSDTPRRKIGFAGQQFTQTFETTALVINGPMANTYLGSVEWGWQADGTGLATLTPPAIRMVRAGLPTRDFMDAANKWNALQFTDTGTGTVYDTVDLPTTSDIFESGMVHPEKRTTANLLGWVSLVNSQLKDLTGPIVDRTNKLFEKRALESELQKRNVWIQVHVNKTEDRGADEVYVKLSAGGKSVKTRVRSLNDGQTGVFIAPLSKLLPLNDPILIEVYDEDWPDRDDLIVNMIWSPPFLPGRNTRSWDKADYRVNIRFEK